MIIYIFLMVAVIIAGIYCYYNGKTDKATKKFCNITIVLFSVIEGLRDVSVGVDTLSYVTWFKEYCSIIYINSIFHPWRSIEAGYSLLNIIISRFTSNEHVLIAIISIIIVTLHIKFIEKNSPDPFLSVLLFMGLNFFLTSMVSWRQFIAMGIVFWVIPLWNEKKYLKAILVMFAAFLFHDTVILFVAAFLFTLPWKNNSRMNVVLLLIFLLVIIYREALINMFLYVLSDYRYYFTASDSVNSIGNLRLLYIIIELALLIIISLKDKSLKKEITGMTPLLSVSILAGVLSLYIPFMFRVGYYFDYFLILIIPGLVPQGKYKRVFEIAIIVCSAILFLYYLSYNPGNTVPYKFFF